MTRLRQESHARMLGNGLCTRPAELDCRMESACETCAYFKTGPEFVPVLLRQRDHARDHHQPERAALFDGLLDRASEAPLDSDYTYNAGTVTYRCAVRCAAVASGTTMFGRGVRC
jgi:hypothetical protein